MATNLVVQSGLVNNLALRYDSQGKPELRFTLDQADGEYHLYLPCCSPGAAGERLASEIDEGDHIIITSGKLAYRKRSTKAGEVSRLEILVWAVDRLSGSPSDASTGDDPALGMSAGAIVDPDGSQKAMHAKPRRRGYTTAALQGGFPA